MPRFRRSDRAKHRTMERTYADEVSYTRRNAGPPGHDRGIYACIVASIPHRRRDDRRRAARRSAFVSYEEHHFRLCRMMLHTYLRYGRRSNSPCYHMLAHASPRHPLTSVYQQFWQSSALAARRTSEPLHSLSSSSWWPAPPKHGRSGRSFRPPRWEAWSEAAPGARPSGRRRGLRHSAA